MNNLDRLADDTLVSLYLEGNDSAFDTLLNRHQSRIFKYIYYRVKNQELAEDLFQDAFVKVVMNLRQGKYAQNGKFGDWVLRLTQNMIHDFNRHASILPFTVSSDDSETDFYNNHDIAINENREIELCEMQTISDAEYLITLLPEEQRKIIYLRLYENLSYKEIANITGVSLNTALGRMHYAIRNLKKIAKSKGLTA